MEASINSYIDRDTGWYMVWYEPENPDIGFAAKWDSELQGWSSFRFEGLLKDTDFIAIGKRIQ